MNNFFALNALLAFSLLPAGAAVINPQAQLRWLEGHIRAGDPSVPGGGWNADDHRETRTDAAAWADQQDLIASTISTTVGSGSMGLDSPAVGAGLTGVVASGFADGRYTATTADAYADVSTLSSFVLALQVDEPVRYRLSGTVSSAQDDGRIYADAWSLVALRRVNLPGDGTTVVLETLVEKSANDTTSIFDVTGTLLPGFTYDVVGLGSVGLRNDPVDLLTGEGAASWNFSLQVTPVPEPSAGVAAAALLAGFAGWRRRRATRA
jgi:MYXO-CTERM domain-containing protein